MNIKMQKYWNNVWIVNIASVILTWLFVKLIHIALPDQPALSWLDIIATATGLSCVWLTRLQSVLCWPVGIVSCVVLAYTYFGYDMPGQAWLQIVFYFPIQFYGWYLWSKIDLNNKLIEEPKYLSQYGLIFAVLSLPLLTIILAVIEHYLYYGNIYIRTWDASIVAASLIGQYLLNRKYVESWLFWLIPVNISSAVFNVYMGAYLYALMYVVFLIHAVFAIYDWHKEAVK